MLKFRHTTDRENDFPGFWGIGYNQVLLYLEFYS